MRSIVWDGTGAVLADCGPRLADDDWVTVDVDLVGLCGTDLHILHGTHPRAAPGLLMGHEFTGRLRLESPHGDWVEGQRVFVNPLVADHDCPTCRRGTEHLCPSLRIIGVDLPGALTSSVVVPARNIVPLPSTIPRHDAALLEPLSTAIRAVERSGLTAGNAAHIVGFGPLGMLVALVARHRGAVVTIGELAPRRRAAAEKAGFVVADPANPVDVAFDCVGHPSVSAQITSLVRQSGTIVVAGMHAGTPPFNLLDVTMNELRVVGSKAYSNADVDAAVAMLAARGLDLTGVVSDVVTIDDVPAAFGRLADGSEMKILVDVARSA